MKQPYGRMSTKRGPPNWVGWVMQAWSASCRGRMSHPGLEWVKQGGMGHAGVG